MNTSQQLLEEKYRRAMAFGKYLEQHPNQTPLDVELQRATCLYRIALHNVLESRMPKEEKRARKKRNTG